MDEKLIEIATFKIRLATSLLKVMCIYNLANDTEGYAHAKEELMSMLNITNSDIQV